MNAARTLLQFRSALAVLLVAVATIAGAWVFEGLGYAPCELCLKQRIPYYVGIFVAAATAFAAHRGGERLARAGLLVLAALFAVGAALALYHSGVELKLFQGPTDCTGALGRANSVDDFMKQLQSTKVVRCDQPALFVFGLSLSNWNVVISAFLAAIAARAR